MPKPQSGASLPLSRIRGSALLPRLGMTFGTPGIRIPYLSRLVSLVLVGRRGRYGEPEEVAALVAFLCSEDAAFINGGIYPIDGGSRAR